MNDISNDDALTVLKCLFPDRAISVYFCDMVHQSGNREKTWCVYADGWPTVTSNLSMRDAINKMIQRGMI